MYSGAYSPQAGWVSPFGNLGIYRLLVSSPELIADFNVLHRLQLPRHPPYALIHLIIYLSTLAETNSVLVYSHRILRLNLRTLNVDSSPRSE